MNLPELKKHRGVNRVLLLFAPERSHPGYMSASSKLSTAERRLRERDIRVLTVFSSGRVYEEDERVDGAHAVDFRRQFGAARDEFTAVLLDTEGKECVRQRGDLDLPSLLGALREESRH